MKQTKSKKTIPWGSLEDSTFVLPETSTVEVLASSLNQKERERLNRIKYVEGELANAMNRISYYERELADCHEEVESKTPELEKLKAEQPIPPSESLVTQMERLSKHKMVKSVEVRGGMMKIYLQPLFTAIRTKAGSRTKKNCFLGCFVVEIPVTPPLEMLIKNLSFSHRVHWSCSSGGSPCLGSWDSIRQAYRDGKWFDLVTLMVTYLQSTDDAAAYNYSHEWRQGRFLKYDPDGQLPTCGAIVRFNASPNDDSNSDIEGEYGIVDAVNPRANKPVHVKFYNGNGWHCTPQGLTVLSIEEAKDLTNYNETAQKKSLAVLESREDMVTLAMLDAMEQDEANANYYKLINLSL